MEENEYHPPPVVTSLVPIEVEEEHNSLQASRFGDDKEEDLTIEEAVESSEDEEVPQENEVPLPVRIVPPLPAYTPSVCSGQRCKRSRSAVSAISISTFNFYFFSPRLLQSFTPLSYPSSTTVSRTIKMEYDSQTKAH